MNDRLYYTDRPSEVDALGFADYRPALVEVITRGETPLTIGIFGSWGTGKTSLLRMLRRDLRRRWSPHFRTVWFTAWKYERTEALWRAFILRVLDALDPREVNPNRPEEEWERIPLENLSEKQQRQVERLHRLEESVYRAV
ncbi:MAG: P-loop NTPase fold protein [Anaerolineae bacterium]|nr:KAP family NTPase [Anaerolineae bacterium]MDW8068123.1 P-loop NTPase fold protein [Anaerolineae bacterium]